MESLEKCDQSERASLLAYTNRSMDMHSRESLLFLSYMYVYVYHRAFKYTKCEVYAESLVYHTLLYVQGTLAHICFVPRALVRMTGAAWRALMDGESIFRIVTPLWVIDT